MIIRFTYLEPKACTRRRSDSRHLALFGCQNGPHSRHDKASLTPFLDKVNLTPFPFRRR